MRRRQPTGVSRDHFRAATKKDNRMTPICHHIPRDQIAAFVHVCRDCGVPIEHVPCESCDGYGSRSGQPCDREECPACDGTGVARWEKAP